MTITQKAEIAMEEAIKKVIAQHKKDNLPSMVWEDGKVKEINLNEEVE